MDWLQTIIIAVVEGLTEFLPVSSTGHMIITQNLLGLDAASLSESDKAQIPANLVAKLDDTLDTVWHLDGV